MTSGGVTETATVTVTVTAVNDAPAGTDKTLTAIEDTAYTFTAADFGFTDPLDAPSSNNFSSVFITTLPTSGTLLLNGVAVTAGQDIAFADISKLTWQGAANAHGTGLASFTFQVKDDGGRANGGQDTDQSANTISFNVTSVINLTAGDDSAQTNEDTSISGSVAGNDATTSGGTLIYTQGSNPAHGTLVFNSDGSYTYTPNANYNGADSFTYMVTDAASGESLTRTVYLTIKPVADLTANADNVATNEDTPVSGSVATNDSTTSGGTLAYVLNSNPAHGTLVFQTDGSYTYTPNADYNGTDSFTYTVIDAAAGERMTQTVTLSIAPVVDIADDAVKTDENHPVKIAVLANDSFEGKPVISTVSPGAHGSVLINHDGTVTYTPNLGWSGEDSFSYTVTSGGVTETASVKVTVIANPIPVGQFDPGNGFAKPLPALIQTDPALHVLISVNEARNEMSLRSGLGIFQADSVTTAELMGAVDPDLSFASGFPKLDQANVLHVQNAVRHLPLAMNDILHVQSSVRASQLESAARNARVNAYNSATPGMSTLFDPFALGAPVAGAKQGASTDDGKKTVAKQYSSSETVQATRSEQLTDAREALQLDLPIPARPAAAQAQAAAGFGSQLQRVAADFRPRVARQATPRIVSR